MRVAYKIILSKAENGYLVTVPDFNCNTRGDDIADAMYMARDVIGLMGITLEDQINFSRLLEEALLNKLNLESRHQV